jgi:hypothetical protein
MHSWSQKIALQLYFSRDFKSHVEGDDSSNPILVEKFRHYPFIVSGCLRKNLSASSSVGLLSSKVGKGH